MSKYTWLLKAMRDAEVCFRSYSGRGMYGRSCLGIETGGFAEDTWAPFASILEVIADDPDQVRDFADLMSKTRQDSLGLGVIFYWPSVEWTEEMENFLDSDDEDNEDEEDSVEVDSEPCVTCGSHQDVIFDPCPYASDIHGDNTKVWKCIACRNQAAADI